MNLSPLPIQKFFGNNGRPLAGGLLFTYEAGTSTKVSTYTDASGNIQNTNPIVLDFRGECRLWLDPKQSYKFVLSPPGDTDPPTRPIWTVDDITVAPQAFDNASDDIGSVNNISLIIPQISSPVAFTRVVFKAAHTNTGPTTIQINGGTAHDLVWQNIAELAGGEIQAGGIYQAIFDGAQWQLQSPALLPWQMRSPEEVLVGITPTNYAYAPGNVLRYGADPTGVADSTAAIQRAIDVAQAGGSVGHNGNLYPINLAATEFVSSGNSVYLPKGTYRITDTLRITSTVKIYGDSAAATVIGYSGGSLTTSDYLFDIGNDPAGTDRLRPLVLQDFSLATLDFVDHGQNSPRGIYLHDVHNWTIQRVNFSQLYLALYGIDSWVGTVDGCLFINNYVGHVHFQAQMHNTNFNGNVFNSTFAASPEQPDGAQVFIRSSWSVNFIGNDFEFAFEHNLLLNNGCRAVGVIGNYFESSPNGYQVYCWDGNSGLGIRGVAIIGNLFNAGGFGITARNTNASPTPNEALYIVGNYAALDSGSYLASRSGTEPLLNSYCGQNYIASGLGEIDPRYLSEYGWKASLTRVITPPQLTADVNNWAPTGINTAEVVRASSDASRTITGIVSNAVSGRELLLMNAGSQSIVLAHENALSSVSNRMVLPGSTNYTIPPGNSVLLWFDSASNRWRLMSSTA
jgi:hypothetical protein